MGKKHLKITHIQSKRCTYVSPHLCITRFHRQPVHVYAVAQSGEFWAHADDAGVFDIINIDKETGSLFKEGPFMHSALLTTRLPVDRMVSMPHVYAWIVRTSHVVATLADLKVHAKTPGHGKLLFDEAMFPKGYASNTREPRVFEIDMKTHEPTRSFGRLR